MAKSGNKKQISFNLIKDLLSPRMFDYDLFTWILIKGRDSFKKTYFQVPKMGMECFFEIM